MRPIVHCARAAALAAACLFVACGGEGGGEPERPDWNVVLVTVDTYRGDHFLTERAGVALTPNLERLAARSVVFPNASSAACVTSPGTASILTGLLPRRVGVVLNTHVLPDAVPTLATELRRSGRRTAAFVGNPVLGPGYGFERGFDTFVVDGVGDLTEAAIEWLDGVGEDERFFLWVHYMDPHGPYTPPASCLELFPADAFEAEQRIPHLKGNAGLGGIPRYQHNARPKGFGDGREYLARYAAEVRAMDDRVGALVDALDARALLPRSVLVLTADHGEALAGDHGFYFCHGQGVTEDQVDVPMLLHYPGCEAGAVVERPVSTVDVLPTVQGLLGLAAPGASDGGDLRAPESLPVVSQSNADAALRDGDWKLRRAPGGAWRLVDLAVDPGEATDVSASHPDVVERLRARLEEVEALPPLAEPRGRGEESEAVREELRQLGYTGDD